MNFAISAINGMPWLNDATSTSCTVEYSKEIKEIFSEYWFPASRVEENVAQTFHSLAFEWRKERGPSSSPEGLAMHHSYQRIIGLGVDVIPLLLSELEREPDHWFWALVAITGVNSVKPENRGNIKSMARDWIEWGKEQGYTW